MSATYDGAIEFFRWVIQFNQIAIDRGDAPVIPMFSAQLRIFVQMFRTEPAAIAYLTEETTAVLVEIEGLLVTYPDRPLPPSPSI
jgi:hypothetical protein